ncbi:hypothetical protein Tco_1386916 [Tanacetum coccineum]
MEEAGPSVTEKPTNGSLCLEVDFENDDDDMMIDAPLVRDLDQLPRFRHVKTNNMEEAGPSLIEKPTNGSLHLELALENSDHDTMIAAPSVRDLDQLAENEGPIHKRGKDNGEIHEVHLMKEGNHSHGNVLKMLLLEGTEGAVNKVLVRARVLNDPFILKKRKGIKLTYMQPNILLQKRNNARWKWCRAGNYEVRTEDALLNLVKLQPIKCLQLNGLGHIRRECPVPKLLSRFRLLQDKMLQMQSPGEWSNDLAINDHLVMKAILTSEDPISDKPAVPFIDSNNPFEGDQGTNVPTKRHKRDKANQSAGNTNKASTTPGRELMISLAPLPLTLLERNFSKELTRLKRSGTKSPPLMQNDTRELQEIAIPTVATTDSFFEEDLQHHDYLNINCGSQSLATKRITTIHPQSLMIGDHTSAVQTRSKVNKTTTGESAFISYIHDQQRNNHTDFQHCLFACFLSQVEPRSVAQAPDEEPSWVDAVQDGRMQQLKVSNVWIHFELPEAKYANGTKWIHTNKGEMQGGFVKRNKARLCSKRQMTGGGH